MTVRYPSADPRPEWSAWASQHGGYLPVAEMACAGPDDGLPVPPAQLAHLMAPPVLWPVAVPTSFDSRAWAPVDDDSLAVMAGILAGVALSVPLWLVLGLCWLIATAPR